MYLPSHFEETRVDELHRVITDNPLGVLVVNGPHGLDANHLPFLLNPDGGGQGHLLAHVARANPLWQQARDGDEVLVVFRGADAYISPKWYPSKHEFHRQVPTWNYRVVHAHGTISIHDDERFVRGVVARLTRAHEARTASVKPWRMTESPKDFIDRMLASIVGIDVAIQRLVGKWKLGQNREERDRRNAAVELEKRGYPAMSAAMTDALARPSKPPD